MPITPIPKPPVSRVPQPVTRTGTASKVLSTRYNTAKVSNLKNAARNRLVNQQRQVNQSNRNQYNASKARAGRKLVLRPGIDFAALRRADKTWKGGK